VSERAVTRLSVEGGLIAPRQVAPRAFCRWRGGKPAHCPPQLKGLRVPSMRSRSIRSISVTPRAVARESIKDRLVASLKGADVLLSAAAPPIHVPARFSQRMHGMTTQKNAQLASAREIEVWP